MSPKCKTCGAEMKPHFPDIKTRKQIGSYMLWLCPNATINFNNEHGRNALIYCLPKSLPQQASQEQKANVKV